MIVKNMEMELINVFFVTMDFIHMPMTIEVYQMILIIYVK